MAWTRSGSDCRTPTCIVGTNAHAHSICVPSREESGFFINCDPNKTLGLGQISIPGEELSARVAIQSSILI